MRCGTEFLGLATYETRILKMAPNGFRKALFVARPPCNFK